MARQVSIGQQSFADMRENGYFIVDKTLFVRDWWRGGDEITLVCRPRRFGKTLTLSMVECFLSLDYAGRGEELFGGMDVWADGGMRALQGTVPVVSLSFAAVKRPTLEETLADVKSILRVAARRHAYLLDSDAVDESDRAFLARVSDDMDDVTATTCLKALCRMLHAHHGVRPVVLLDEYDTPMQEAWLGGYWEGMSTFVRSLFNSTFKTNPSLGRALITGITRVASESIFSDLNNPRVVTVTTPAYEESFGFTQAEVDAALGEFGLLGMRDGVREWYDGFRFGDPSRSGGAPAPDGSLAPGSGSDDGPGGASDGALASGPDEAPGIYNPWSITSFLQDRRLAPYWVNTSSNALVSSLVRRGDGDLKRDFEVLLDGGSVTRRADEAVVFADLDYDDDAVWPLLLATGYVRPAGQEGEPGEELLKLKLTNHEVREGFRRMVRNWFGRARGPYNGFCRALLAGDAEAMTDYLADLAEGVMSSFDSAAKPSRQLPERFWHGLVLGLLVELRGRYEVRSQPESGYGRCDVVLAPLDGPGGADPAVVVEFKVVDARRGEETLEDAAATALAQIRDKRYAAALEGRGIEPGRIRCYGIAFQGKEVLVGE